MKTQSRRERIAAQLADLKMPGALEALDEVLSGVDGGGTTAAEAIERLLRAQIQLRNSRRLQTAMRSSRLPAIKTLAEFDFSFQPSIKREQIASLHELGFVERKENVVFLGPPGVGKTHLAISVAITAAENGRRVYYGTLTDLIASLEEAEAAREEARAALQREEAASAEKHTRLGGVIERLEAEIAAKQAERETCRARLTAALVAQYEDLRRRRGGVAVTHMQGSICTGCRVTVPPSARKRALDPETPTLCPNCERILVGY